MKIYNKILKLVAFSQLTLMTLSKELRKCEEISANSDCKSFAMFEQQKKVDFTTSFWKKASRSNRKNKRQKYLQHKEKMTTLQ